jgi:hypothetical protein
MACQLVGVVLAKSMTTDPMTGLNLLQHRGLLAANLHDIRTPGMELAARRRREKAADDPFDRVQKFLFLLGIGNRFHQALRVRV